jgi:hypothetical protein
MNGQAPAVGPEDSDASSSFSVGDGAGCRGVAWNRIRHGRRSVCLEATPKQQQQQQQQQPMVDLEPT